MEKIYKINVVATLMEKIVDNPVFIFKDDDIFTVGLANTMCV